MKQITVSVIDPVGLHARPATVAVNAASKFKCEVNVSFKGREVNMKLLFPAMVMTKMLQSLQSKKYCALRKSSVNKRERLRAQSC